MSTALDTRAALPMAVPAGPPARIVVGLAVVLLLVVFVTPARVYLLMGAVSSYQTTVPPNAVDFAWGAVLAMAVLWAKRIPLAPMAAIGVLLLTGSLALGLKGSYGLLNDLLLFNARLLAGLLLGYLVAGIPESPRVLMRTYLAGSVLVAGSTILLLFGGGGSYDFYDAMRRYGGLGLAPNSATALYAAAFNTIPLLAGRRGWLAVLAPVLFAGIMATGSRAGLILAMPGLVLWVRFLVQHPRVPGDRLRRLMIFLLVGSAAAWIGWRWTQFVVEGLVASSVARLAETGSDVSWLGRVGIWNEMIRYVAGAPRVLLLGLGGSDAAVEDLLKNVLGIDTLHAHNIILQIVAASGVVGLTVWTWMTRGVFRGWRREPDDNVQGLRVFAVTLLVAHLVDYSLWQEKFLLLFALLLGFFLAWQRTSRMVQPQRTIGEG